jgi:hypothetical protein
VKAELLVSACIITASLLLASLMSGCQTKPRIRSADTRITGQAQQDQPATLTTATSSLPVPAQTIVVAAPDGTLSLTLPTASSLTTATQSASTGGTSQAVAIHRIDSDRAAKLAARQMQIGVGLMLLGALVGFVLPGPLRWPMAGMCIAGVGLVLIVLRDPPQWLIGGLSFAAVASVLAFFILRNSRNS